MVDNPDPATVIERLAPFVSLGPLAQQQVVITSDADVMAEAADIGPEGQQGFGSSSAASTRPTCANRAGPDHRQRAQHPAASTRRA
ncbi:hypothetical protein ACGFI4_14755 [Micromonospora carbonacea]|uniref:hypothetical protein n=1 Tax=Micromonospora carbonacea TaxID=47853 RepID=UPI00371D33D4